MFEEAQGSGKVPEKSYIIGDDEAVQWGRRGAKEEGKVGNRMMRRKEERKQHEDDKEEDGT